MTGAGDRKWDRLRGAQREGEVRRVAKNIARVDWKRFRAHFGQNRSGAVGRCNENGQRMGDHEVSKSGIGLRAWA